MSRRANELAAFGEERLTWATLQFLIETLKLALGRGSRAAPQSDPFRSAPWRASSLRIIEELGNILPTDHRRPGEYGCTQALNGVGARTSGGPCQCLLNSRIFSGPLFPA